MFEIFVGALHGQFGQAWNSTVSLDHSIRCSWRWNMLTQLTVSEWCPIAFCRFSRFLQQRKHISTMYGLYHSCYNAWLVSFMLQCMACIIHATINPQIKPKKSSIQSKNTVLYLTYREFLNSAQIHARIYYYYYYYQPIYIAPLTPHWPAALYILYMSIILKQIDLKVCLKV